MAIGHAFQCTEAGAGASAGLGPGVGPGPGAGPAGASYVEGDSQADEEESDAADDDDEEEELASFEEDSTIAIPDEIELAEVGSMEKTLSTIFNLSDAEEEDGDGDELDGCFGGIEIGLSEFEQRDDGDAAVGAEGENDENRLLDEGEARTTDGDGGEGPEKGARGGGPSPLSLSGACTPREALAQQGDDANRPNEAGEAAGGAAPSTGGGGPRHRLRSGFRSRLPWRPTPRANRSRSRSHRAGRRTEGRPRPPARASRRSWRASGGYRRARLRRGRRRRGRTSPPPRRPGRSGGREGGGAQTPAAESRPSCRRPGPSWGRSTRRASRRRSARSEHLLPSRLPRAAPTLRGEAMMRAIPR